MGRNRTQVTSRSPERTQTSRKTRKGLGDGWPVPGDGRIDKEFDKRRRSSASSASDHATPKATNSQRSTASLSTLSAFSN
jgi:hypothetical protein